MGYNTSFDGELKFTRPLLNTELSFVKSMFDIDLRDIDETKFIKPKMHEDYASYIDLEFSKDYSGIKWNGAEKTYGMVTAINFIIDNAKDKIGSDFGLAGEFRAQGEDIEDHWYVKINDKGEAYRAEREIIGQRCECPNCGKTFIMEE